MLRFRLFLADTRCHRFFQLRRCIMILLGWVAFSLVLIRLTDVARFTVWPLFFILILRILLFRTLFFFSLFITRPSCLASRLLHFMILVAVAVILHGGLLLLQRLVLVFALAFLAVMIIDLRSLILTMSWSFLF